MKTIKKHYRQGDVLIERIDEIPKNAVLEKSTDIVILAHGEVTGHNHAFSVDEAEKLTIEDGSEFFRITGSPLSFTIPIIRKWKDQVMVKHPTKGIIEFSESDVVIENGNAIVEGNFGLLRHDEHHTHGIPAGLYKGAGADKTVHQREYAPEAIRRVVD